MEQLISKNTKEISLYGEGNMVIEQKETASKIKNFRLSKIDQDNLVAIVDRLKQISSKSISETLVIKALLSLGRKVKPARILKEAKASLKAKIDLQM